MAKTAEESMRRYATGTQNAGTLWNAAKGRMQANWASSVGAGPIRSARYAAGLNSATYKAGDPQKWYTNWRAAMSQ